MLQPLLRARAGAAALLGLSFISFSQAGCGSATSERLQAWKTTPEGQERLAKALRDSSLTPALRGEAAAALTEVGMVDRVESAVAGMPFEERAQVIAAATPLVGRGLQEKEAARFWDAHEVLMMLRRHSTTDAGTRDIDALLMPALERDVRTGQLEGGRHSVKEMLAALGPAALPVLTKLMADGKAPFAVPVELLDKVADNPTREAGSAALVKRARAVKPVPPELWKALSTLGGAPAIAYLQETVEKWDSDAQLEAARALAAVRPDPTLVAFAIKIARNAGMPRPVRDQMLAQAEKIGNEEARTGLVEIIANDKDPEIRFQAFASVCKAGTGRQLLAALEAFPAGLAYTPEQIRERLVAPIAAMGYGGRPDVFKALQSKSPLARLVAVWFLEKSGFASDAPQLSKVVNDKGSVKGLPAGTTIGREATRVVATLKKQPA
jgi:hypothetical protein